MKRFLIENRWVLIAYTIAGFSIGTGFSLWHFAGKLDKYYRHPDGSITTSAERTEPRIDAKSGKQYDLAFRTGRPLSTFDKMCVFGRDALPILLSSALVGFFWGLVHLGVRSWAPGHGDQNAADYCESNLETCPPVST